VDAALGVVGFYTESRTVLVATDGTPGPRFGGLSERGDAPDAP
jgi:hypothetical protein